MWRRSNKKGALPLATTDHRVETVRAFVGKRVTVLSMASAIDGLLQT
jgi:hypothetical protein